MENRLYLLYKTQAKTVCFICPRRLSIAEHSSTMYHTEQRQDCDLKHGFR